MPAAKIIDLRNFLAERFPQGRASAGAQLSTGLADFDEAGGLTRGTITELISPQASTGSASLVHQLIQNARRDRYFVALIDGADSFDPHGVDPDCLGQLLWVRCLKAAEAIKAADLLLRDGNFSLVIVDLILNSAGELRKIPKTSWYRLQRLVESLPTAGIVLTREGIVSSAQLKIVLDNSWKLQMLDDNAAEMRFHVQRSHRGANRRLQAR